MYELSDKEFEAVKVLNAEYRKAYFEEKIKSQQGFFMLVNEEGPVLLKENEGEDSEMQEVLPVWCHERYVECFKKFRPDLEAKAQFITVAAWNAKWVEALSADESVLIGYMPLGDDDFIVDKVEAF